MSSRRDSDLMEQVETYLHIERLFPFATTFAV